MRLDEWQKYLDAQFVDETLEARSNGAAKPKDKDQTGASQPGADSTATKTGSASQQAVPAGHHAKAATQENGTASARVYSNGAEGSNDGAMPAEQDSKVSADTRRDRPVSGREPARTGISAKHDSSPVPGASHAASGVKDAATLTVSAANGENESPGPSADARRSSIFGEPPGSAADVPQIDRYLPSTHAAVHGELSALKAPPAENGRGGSSNGAASARYLDGAFSVLMPVTPSYTPPRHTPKATTSTPAQVNERTSEPARRSSRPRARHARNVRPEHVPYGLSAAELWATVPKHVQTLLALGRMEEIEEEVAQSSYKRPFQETRQELIERLLDPILSLEDTARLLNVCPTTVRRYTNKGILTHYRKEPENPSAGSNSDKETRQRRFRLSDILAFLETQQAAVEADRSAVRRRPSSEKSAKHDPSLFDQDHI